MMYNTNIQKAATFSALAALFFIPLSTTIGQILTYLTVLLILPSTDWPHRLQLIKKNPLVWVTFGFVMILALGFFYGPATLTLKWHIFTKYLWILLLPFFMISLSADLLEKYSASLFLCAIGITLVLSYLHITGIIHFGIGHASVFQGHIVQNLLFSIALFICLERAARLKNQRWLYAIFALALLINTLFLSLGRTGYLSMPVVILYFCYKQFGVKKIFIPILLLAALGVSAYFISPTFHSRIQETKNNTSVYLKTGENANNTSVGIRLRDAKTALWLFKQKPILGYGLGGIADGTKTYIAKNKLQPLDSYDPLTDSDYLNILVQHGLVGLAGLLFFIGFLLYRAHYLSDYEDRLVHAVLFTFLATAPLFTWLTNVTMRGVLLMLLAASFARFVQRT